MTGRIKSPTYAVLEPHEAGGLAIAHLDFYRFADPREWADAGLRDVFAQPGLKLAEWSERVQGFLPPADLRLRIEPVAPGAQRLSTTPSTDDAPEGCGHPDARQVQAEALTARGLALLEALQPNRQGARPDAA